MNGKPGWTTPGGGFRQIPLLLACNSLEKVLGIGTMLFLVRSLSPEDYGVLSFATFLFHSFSSALLSFDQPFLRQLIASESRDTTYFAGAAGKLLLILVNLGIMLGVGFVAGSSPMALSCVLILCLGVFLQSWVSFLYQIPQIQGQTRAIALGNLFMMVVYITSAMAAVFWGASLWIVAGALVWPRLILLPFLLIHTRGYLRARCPPDWREIRFLAFLSLIPWLVELLMGFYIRFDVFFMTRLGWFAEVGYYSLPQRILLHLGSFSYLIGVGFFARLARLDDQNHSNPSEQTSEEMGRISQETLIWALLANLLPAIAMIGCPENLVRVLFGEKYLPAAAFLPGAALILLVQGANYALYSMTIATRRLSAVVWVAACGLTFNVLCNLWWIVQWKAMGALWIRLATEILVLSGQLVVLRHLSRSWWRTPSGPLLRVLGLIVITIPGAFLLRKSFPDWPVTGTLLWMAFAVFLAGFFLPTVRSRLSRFSI